MSTPDEIHTIALQALNGTDIERVYSVSILEHRLRKALQETECWREALNAERRLAQALADQLEFAHVEIERSEVEREAAKPPPGERVKFRLVKP